VQEFNLCVKKCSEKVTKTENVTRTFLDALADRVENCLDQCYGAAGRDPTKWSNLQTSEAEKKLQCAVRCYEQEEAWILNQSDKWRSRILDVLTDGPRSSGIKRFFE
jgi:hypothetical protein